ncbi:DUF4432 family protein [Nonomuraea sp. NPDC050556]|uniref:DUF4432 family protein n=1 Tax=Nonomuraea sp. NPDC050556 TaxID=3364369 RepID=UPI0037B1692C
MRRNWAARIHEVIIQGMRAVVLENEFLRVTVLADKGGDVVEFLYKPTDTDYVWLSPQGLREDARHLAADDVGAFIDHYEGGWQEIFPNGGAPSTYQGARLAQHGEVATLPWDYTIVADAPESVSVRLRVRTRRLPYELEKTFTLAKGSKALEVRSEARNASDQELHAMWGQHIVFGPPFLKPGRRIRLPDGIKVIPHPEAINPTGRLIEAGGPYAWPTDVDLSVIPEPGGPSEIVYLTGFEEGWYEIDGFRVEWDASLMPYLWMWQELGASTGYPWWGQAYVVGLEPFSSMPTDGLAAAVDNGTALTLGPGETKVLRMRAEVLT